MTPSIEIRKVRLRVANLERSLAFYSALGFVVGHRASGEVELAAPASGDYPSRAALVLLEDSAAPPKPPQTAGLFHAAALLPSREALGRWLRIAAGAGLEFDGFSDHAVSEAIYLADPDGNGLEFYADRPRESWPERNGLVEMITAPLDVRELLRSAEINPPAATLPLAGATWGHLHFQVTDLDRSEAFYRETLGLALRQRFGHSARFLAADGYHHHVGLNTWNGANQPLPPHTLGLVDATLGLKTLDVPKKITDPDGIPLELVPSR